MKHLHEMLDYKKDEIKQLSDEAFAKFLPYAEEGITYDELELLGKSKKNNRLHKDFETHQQSLNPEEWNPELIVRIHGILSYLILREWRKTIDKDFEFYGEDELKTYHTFNGLKIYWVINQNQHVVHVSLRDSNTDLRNYSFDFTEISNPTRIENMKKFDL